MEHNYKFFGGNRTVFVQDMQDCVFFVRGIQRDYMQSLVQIGLIA